MAKGALLNTIETPVDRHIREQKILQTPVATFATAHEGGTIPDQTQFFQKHIPLKSPAPGEQYAFRVELDKCTGCKSCVAACHSLNGLDDEETWRDVGLIHGHDESGSYQQTVTSACHHCLDPACLNGCPVNAYEKDKLTGIVHHLDDQCIGCQYCVMMCPYDAPKYNHELGIVRKCDMCHGRLESGEAPACVQSCPNEAIEINLIDQAQLKNDISTGNDNFLSAGPGAMSTQPTSQYITKKTMPQNILAADQYLIRQQEAHYPLVFMLVLTQLSLGAYTFSLIMPQIQIWLQVLAIVACGIGLFSSTLHLGKPLKAWRAFLGLRKSWLSREIILFSAYFTMLSFVTGISSGLLPIPHYIANLISISCLLIGYAAVFSSAMLYHVTLRLFWKLSRTSIKFYGTSFILGLTISLAILSFSSQNTEMKGWLGLLLINMMGIKLALDVKAILHTRDLEFTPSKQSALIMLKKAGRITAARFLFGLIGGILLPISGLSFNWPIILCFVIFVCCLFAELAERILFFKAVDAPKMPGGISV